jgi:hypothetical protein
MLRALRFEHGGRTYTCQTESREGLEGEWWWCTVSSDGIRYAPFKASSRDTKASVQARIIEYYTNHLARRAQPEPHWARQGKVGRPKGKVTVTAPGAAPAARQKAAKRG